MARSFGLRTVLALLVLIAIAPVFAVVLQASLSEQESRLERAEQNLKALVDLSAANQEQFIESARQMLTAVSNSPPVYGDDAAACSRYFAKVQAQYPLYAAFGLLDENGRGTCRTAVVEPPAGVATERGPLAEPVISSDRRYFQEAVRTGRFAVGEYVVGRSTGKQALTFGMPVYREDTSLRGVLFAAVDLQRADEQLRKLASAPDITLFTADANGTVLVSAGPAALPVGARMSYSFLAEAIQARAPRLERAATLDGDWLYAVKPVGRTGEDPLFAAAMMSTADVVAPARSRLHLQLGALVVISLLGAACAWTVGDRVVARPIARLLGRVDALEREELPLDTQPPRSVLRELTELDRRFHGMARALAQRSVQRDGAMAEMEAQKDLLESVVQSMGEGLLVTDRHAHLLHLNAAAKTVLPGVEALYRDRHVLDAPAEAWGMYMLDGTTPLPSAMRTTGRALRGEVVENFRFVARGLLTGGVHKVIQSSARPLRSPGGGNVGAVVVFADVTADHDAALALRESEQRYRTLFESNPHPMWVYDLRTLRFLTVNDAAVSHYGYTRQEFLAMTIADIRPETDLAAMIAAVEGNAVVHRPQAWRHRLKDGRVIWSEVSSHTLSYAGRTARMVLAHDITAQLEAQRELQLLNETLEARVSERTRALNISNQELESFSYSVSHDLRAPLQVIDGFSRTLAANYGPQLDDRARHFLERIRDNTRQMSALIDDLLLLAKVTRAEIRAETVPLAAKAASIVDQLRTRFPDREVAVEIEDGLCAEGDPRLLSVVLENLLDNAWKFTAHAEGARVRIGKRDGADGEPVFFVEDNGAGFDMAYADKLFTAFQRLHTPSEFEGTGIGLATVHRIISRHGGRVWAQAAPGRGASFQFTLGKGTA